MGTRRKLSVSVNNCGICGGVLKVGDPFCLPFVLSRQQLTQFHSLACMYLWITSFIAQVSKRAYLSYHSSILV